MVHFSDRTLFNKNLELLSKSERRKETFQIVLDMIFWNFATIYYGFSLPEEIKLYLISIVENIQ